MDDSAVGRQPWEGPPQEKTMFEGSMAILWPRRDFQAAALSYKFALLDFNPPEAEECLEALDLLQDLDTYRGDSHAQD